jgi:integrase
VADLDRFYACLSEKYKPSTINNTHRTLRAVLNQAVKWDWLTDNPAEKATPPLNRVVQHELLEPEQVAAMVKLAQLPRAEGGNGDLVLAAAMALAAVTGARRGELCGLRWDDFDTATGRLDIARQFVPQPGGQRLETLKSNTGAVEGRRPFFVNADLVTDLERFRARQREELELEPHGWLLSYDGGSTPMQAASLNTKITALGKKLGLKVSPHSFRRFAETQANDAGVDLITNARLHGHRPEIAARHYIQPSDANAIAAGDKLAARLKSGGLPIGELLAPPPDV